MRMLDGMSNVSAAASRDNFIRSRQYRVRDREPERLCSLRIDDQLERGGPLDWQVGGLGTLQDLVHVRGGTAESRGELRAVGQQTSIVHEFPLPVHGGKAGPRREFHQPLS